MYFGSLFRGVLSQEDITHGSPCVADDCHPGPLQQEAESTGPELDTMFKRHNV